MKSKGIKRALFIGIQILILLSPTLNAQDVKDLDGNIYKTSAYGRQVWTSSNLNVSHFRNGDIIPEAKTPEEWIIAAKSGRPAWCIYENLSENCSNYGKLYNWFAINDLRGLAPDGWNIPANADWMTLVNNLQGVDVAGTKLKSTTGWKSKKGTDNIGFSALPGGYRNQEGKFNELGETGQWWSNSEPVEITPSGRIYTVKLSDNSYEVSYVQSEKGEGFSVRCVKK